MTGGGPTDHVRDEAERLIAAAINAVSMAARGLGGVGRDFATGGPECCLCPVCRVIAAMRDPRADVAERLAAGAGDLATGVASILRAFAPAGVDPESTREGDEFWESLRQRARSAGWNTEEDPWRAATHGAADADRSGESEPPEPRVPPKPMAKKAVKKAAAQRSGAGQHSDTGQRPGAEPRATAGPSTSAEPITTPDGSAQPARKRAKKAAGKAVPPVAGGADG